MQVVLQSPRQEQTWESTSTINKGPQALLSVGFVCWVFLSFLCVCGETVYSGLRDGEQQLRYGLHAPHVTQARCCHVPKGFSQIRGLGQIHQFMHHLPNITNTTVSIDVKRVIKLQNNSPLHLLGVLRWIIIYTLLFCNLSLQVTSSVLK